MVNAADDSSPSAFTWVLGLIMSLNLRFLATFFYDQFRPVPYPRHDFTGKTVIVTGSNVGLGLEAARHFRRLGAAKVILGCRSEQKALQAIADIERSTGRANGVLEFWPLDLTSFDSVREFCKKADGLERLDAVIENAAVAMASQESTLAEGYECTITVNVISTFLMALLLLPGLLRTARKFNTQPRLTIVSSDAHFLARFHEKTEPSIFEAFRSSKCPSDRYPTSKLLEIFAVRQLAEEMSKPSSTTKGSVILNTLNPGFCRTSLFRDNKFPASIFIAAIGWSVGRSAEAGSRVLVYAANAGPESHGKFLDTCAIKAPSAYVRSKEGAQMQARVYEELMGLLEKIEPGITKNI